MSLISAHQQKKKSIWIQSECCFLPGYPLSINYFFFCVDLHLLPIPNGLTRTAKKKFSNENFHTNFTNDFTKIVIFHWGYKYQKRESKKKNQSKKVSITPNLIAFFYTQHFYQFAEIFNFLFFFSLIFCLPFIMLFIKTAESTWYEKYSALYSLLRL